jgi:hypothetical protein
MRDAGQCALGGVARESYPAVGEEAGEAVPAFRQWRAPAADGAIVAGVDPEPTTLWWGGGVELSASFVQSTSFDDAAAHAMLR